MLRWGAKREGLAARVESVVLCSPSPVSSMYVVVGSGSARWALEPGRQLLYVVVVLIVVVVAFKTVPNLSTRHLYLYVLI